MEAAVRIEALSFAWPGRSSLFEGLELEIGRGEAWAVVGASGSGKSSLLSLLAGLERPSSGRILVGGEELGRPRPGTGLVLQDHGLLPWATLRENVALGPRLRRFYGPDGIHSPKVRADGPNGVHAPRHETRRRGAAGPRAEALAAPRRESADAAAVQAWLERLGIAAVADAWPSRVSGGQRQRAAIARSLVLEPDLLLMDEPFSSLDEATREDLRSLSLAICKERGMTLILVTHSIDEALAVGDRILLLEGRAGAAEAGTATSGSSGIRGPGPAAAPQPSPGAAAPAASARPAAYRVLDKPRGDAGALAALKLELRRALETGP